MSINKQIKTMLILLIVACTNKPAEKQKEKYAEPFPVVKDTMGHENFASEFYSQKPDAITNSRFLLYYIGPRAKTLYLNFFDMMRLKPPPLLSKEACANYKLPESPLKNYLTDYNEENTKRYSKKGVIEIRVDTTQSIYNSYPVLIVNKGDDTTIVGASDNFSLALEALDSLGKWRSIQQPHIIGCGTGLRCIILPPDECGLTLLYKFTGDYKTKLRLRFENYYSEPFNGSIPYWLFDYVKRNS